MTVARTRRNSRVLFAAATTFLTFASAAAATGTSSAQAQTPPETTKPAAAPPPPGPTAKSVRPPQTTKPAMPALPPVVRLPANIVVRVGGRNITREELLAFVDMTHGGQYVDQLVNNALLQQEASRLNVSVSKEELEARIRTLKDQIVQNQFSNGGIPMSFQQIAEREGFTDDLLRWSAYTELLRRKTLEKSLASSLPTMDDQRQLAHILFTTLPTNATPDQANVPPSPAEQQKKDAEAKKRIEALLADLKAGKITWEEAARQSDDKANADKGGELGFVSRTQLDGGFGQAAWMIAKSGDIVGPVKSQFGWHLIKLEKKGSEVTAAEKATFRKTVLDQQLNNPEVLATWLRDLRGKTKIERNPVPVLVPGAKSPARVADNLKSAGKPPVKPAPKPATVKTGAKPTG